MRSPFAGWRLPLRLAWRDLTKHKGRSALAALLILLPVTALAGALTFATTNTIDEGEERAQMFRTARAYVSFNGFEPGTGHKPFPASGRPVDPDDPPTAAEVSRQAGAPAIAQTTVSAVFNPAVEGTDFTPTTGQYFATDLHSPIIGDTVTVAEGRLPQKAGEIVVTDLGRERGLPTNGPIHVAGDASPGAVGATDDSSGAVTVVGVVHTRLPSIYAAGPFLASVTGKPTEFAIGGSDAFTKERVEEWATYGAGVRSADYLEPRHERVEPDAVIAFLMATMAFICVTAMLAAPAFAAGATRHRRSLGLIASNGGTRANLRKVVLAQALLLGAITAVAACAVGAAGGTLVGRWYTVRTIGVTPPTDVNVGWLVAVVAVATVASLVSAYAPARSAGRTNLLAALRGQVSSRTVKRRWPAIGLMLVALAALCLFCSAALTEAGDDDNNIAMLLVVLGMPMLFGGAVMAVPYLLMLTGFLARHLPLTARLAVRDVSRQRTRATAAIGAVLATVAVFSGVSVVGASVDQYEAKRYRPNLAIGTGLFDMPGPASPSDAQVAAAVASVKQIAGDATPQWGQSSSEHTRILGLPGECVKGKTTQYWPSITAIDPADVPHLGLTASQRAILDGGGVLVVGRVTPDEHLNHADGEPGTSLSPGVIKGGRLTVPRMTTGGSKPDSGVEITACAPITLAAAQVSHSAVWASLHGWPGSIIMTRPTAARLNLPMAFAGITVAPQDGIDANMEARLQALAPLSMRLAVEHGFSSPIQKILALITVTFALIVLLTTVVSTLLNDAESQADSATLATVGAPLGMRRRIVGAQAFVLGFVGSAVGIAIGVIPGLLLAGSATRPPIQADTGAGPWSERSIEGASTYVIPWWALLVMLVGVPIVAALISMVFARRNPTLARREA